MESGKKNGSIVAIVILTILVLLLGGYIGYDKLLNKKDTGSTPNNSSSEISNPTENQESNDSTTENSVVDGNGFIFSEKNTSAESQRYKLVVVSGGIRTATNEIDSENDKYYLLDMNKLGTSQDIKQIDLVSIMKPVTDDTIKNKMPSSSKNASGQVTNLSQCKSFSVEYYEPFSNEYISQSTGLNLKTDVPIAVTYSCNTNDYSVAFYRVVYVLNAETNKVTEYQYGKTSDFSVQ